METKLKKVKDDYAILSLLSSAKDNSSDVFIWKLIGNIKHLAQVRIESIRKLRNDFCIVPGEGQDRSVQNLIGTHNFVDLFIPESALLLRCKIKTSDAPLRYYLEIPDFVAQAERRNHFRLDTHDSGEVKVKFGKTVLLPKQMSQHFYKDCLDVSSGGFSFYASRLEVKFFQNGDEIPAIELRAGNWVSKVSGQVAMIREVEPDEHNGLSYRVWRVSCRFTQIDQVSRKYLEKYIFERIKEDLHAINE